MTDPAIERAMWEGDIDTLNELASCGCCCSEHTLGQWCPAWQWGGCRGYSSNGLTEHQETEAWRQHYARFHGMTDDQFFGYANVPTERG